MPVRIATTLPVAASVADNLDHARWADAEGLDVWLTDGGGPDALTLAGLLVAATRRARIGIAVTPVYTRTPAVLASASRVLADASEGRFALGVGASSPVIVERWNGLAFDRPLTRVRETVGLLRAMLAGERTDFDGETIASHGYRQPPTEHPVPIVLGALRERMLRLAGELGDGVALNLAPRASLPNLIATMREGIPTGSDYGLAGREVIARHQVLVTDDPERARETFRRKFTAYLGTGVYNRFLAWCGFEREARALAAAWRAGDREGTRAVLDAAMIDRIAVIGSAEHCRELLRETSSAGVDTHVLVPLTDDPAEARATQAALGPETLGL